MKLTQDEQDALTYAKRHNALTNKPLANFMYDVSQGEANPGDTEWLSLCKEEVTAVSEWLDKGTFKIAM